MNPEKTEAPEKSKCASLFDVNNVIDGFTTVLKKRPNNMRA